MTKARPETIALKLHGEKLEAPALAADLKPGMLAAVNADGKAIPHPGAAGTAAAGRVLVVLEQGLNGSTIDTVYATGEPVQMRQLVPGDEVLLRSKVDEAYTRADGVIREAGAIVKKTTGTPAATPFEALETYTAVASSPFIAVGVI